MDINSYLNLWHTYTMSRLCGGHLRTELSPKTFTCVRWRLLTCIYSHVTFICGICMCLCIYYMCMNIFPFGWVWVHRTKWLIIAYCLKPRSWSSRRLGQHNRARTAKHSTHEGHVPVLLRNANSFVIILIYAAVSRRIRDCTVLLRFLSVSWYSYTENTYCCDQNFGNTHSIKSASLEDFIRIESEPRKDSLIIALVRFPNVWNAHTLFVGLPNCGKFNYRWDLERDLRGS